MRSSGRWSVVSDQLKKKSLLTTAHRPLSTASNSLQLQRRVVVAIEFVEVADGAVEYGREVFDVCGIEDEVDAADKGGVRVARAHVGRHVDEEGAAARGGAKRANLAVDEGCALLGRVKVGREQNDVHPIFAHALDGLRRIFGDETLVAVLDQHARNRAAMI